MALALSWWSYRHFKTINPVARYGLMGLRGLVFFILLALLMNPLFKSETVEYLQPRISVLLDNSRSIAIEKGRYEGSSSYRNVLDQLNFDRRDNFRFSFYSFDKKLSSVNPDTIGFNGSKTDLNAALDHIHQNSEETNAALLFTDGIYTTGQDPTYLSRQLDVPLYVIGLGDTVSVRDLVVKNVVSSRTGYTNTEHPVETTIINDGFDNENVTVQLRSDNRVVAQQSFTPTGEKSAHTLTFQVPLQEAGLHQYEIYVPEKPQEWTDANNRKAFSIDVRDNRNRILHAAFEVHPDVKSLRWILSGNKNTSLTSRTWIGGQRFLEGPLPEKADTLDLLILHGYPHEDMSTDLHRRIVTLADELPLVFIRSPKQNLAALPSGLQSQLPVSASSPPSVFKTGIYPIESQSDHPVMDLSAIAYENLPSIRAPIQGVSNGPAATPLFNITYQGEETDVPFISIQKLGNKRSALINGFGFYRLRQHPEESTRSFITGLLHNLVAWSAAETDDKLLQLDPAQQVFDAGDPVRLNAFLRNESGQRESEASIDITVENESFGSRQYTMTNKGDGQYSLSLGTLAEGIYKFTAEAEKGGQIIDSREGEFSVAPARIEYVNTTRDQQLLKQVAGNTGGKFYDFNEIDSVWRDMRESGVLEETEQRQTRPFYPYQHVFWFLVVVTLLGAEWLLRKYFALP